MASAAILEEPSPAFILMSRILIGMIALLLAILPWSERYSNLDSFPHGHDAELGFLAILAVFGLILLLLRAAEKQLSDVFVVRYLLFLIIPWASSLHLQGHQGLTRADSHDPPLPGLSLEMYNLPLQI